jgi:HD-GYP domain-containing protein (c-di-GMP phosphodiesterase class II)
MSKTISNFQAITFTLSHETQLDSMLGKVLERLIQATGVRGGAVYLHDNDTGILKLAASDQSQTYPKKLHLAVHSQTDLAARVAQALESQAHYLAVALNNRNEELLGILLLQLAPEHEQTGSEHQPFRHFVEELSGAAAVAIETRQLIEAQQRLLDAIIKLLANAIDAKSPYTGGHCERVPHLAELLLDQVINADSGPYAHFGMSDAERYEFQIAAWLHDCGKITSPEAVMDKATKLETQYNRIHEIRTRFEVLWRDAEIAFWQGRAQGGDENALTLALEHAHAELQEEFAVVANANIGGEFMDDNDIERIKQIGSRRWRRNFDSRLGLAPHEAGQLPAATVTPLPAEECLLADRPEHLVHWGENKPPVDKNDPRNTWGFDMQIPAHANNYGELYNLSIQRGTLTPEERFKINEHIVQTIIMLDSLPLPNNLKRVPSIAGNHHEKMDGTGYPRRLGKDDMGIAERVMAIADIFEALTAADRPYKTAKTLSESIEILAGMARNQHIDPELFRLFLTSGAYLTYSEKYLDRAQIDDVDIERYLDGLDGAAVERHTP